ncbi:MAG TPA: HAD family hydrolase [Candidatus Binatia bacterium]|jgi:phosphoglycolate phosphatase-like HAD superfamily hydrolase
MLRRAAVAAVFVATCFGASRGAADDQMPSWKDGAAKKAIVSLVSRVTTPGPDLLPPPARIAVFDNDGTLWAEQPMYFQLMFSIERIKALAPAHPEWKQQEPFASLLRGDVAAAFASTPDPELKIAMASQAGLTIPEFEQSVREWFASARHPTTGRLLSEMVYQPMLEVLRYLRANGFRTYIVSGGGIEFMRVFAEQLYGIPPEQVVGSTNRLQFEMRGGKPAIVNAGEIAFTDDKGGKPVGIYLAIGRHPILAFGNSDGDLAMLQYTCDGAAPELCVYIHHTDAAREWAYDRTSKIGRLDKGLDEAKTRRWTVVDMKSDWKTVFGPRHDKAD